MVTLCVQESTLIWNQTTVISVKAESVQEQIEQIVGDVDGIESRLRELEQQADEDEQLVTQVRPPLRSAGLEAFEVGPYIVFADNSIWLNRSVIKVV